MSDLADRYTLDHRIIFIAACSSFITLLLLNILDRYRYIQFNKNLTHDINQVTNTQIHNHKSSIPLSASNQSLFTNIISKESYIHNSSKEDEYFESDAYWNLIPLNNPKWVNTKLKLLIEGRYSESLHQRMLDHFDPKSFEPLSNPYLNEITTAIHRFNEWRRWPQHNAINMIYFFKDGSCLMGSTKCNDESLFQNDKQHVRATITLMMYHIRPHYDGNINLTKVTFYSHVLLNGSIPQWMLNFAYMEIVDTFLKMEKYVKNKLHTLYKRGELYVPPHPFLKMIGLFK